MEREVGGGIGMGNTCNMPVLYNLFYIVLTYMISLNLMMVHFYPCHR